MATENTLPDVSTMADVQTDVDLSISQLPLLRNLTGDEVTIITANGSNYKMSIYDLAAGLSQSVVSGSDLERKADKIVVTALEDKVNLIDQKAATKPEVAALGLKVAELDLTKATRESVQTVEARTAQLEVRAGETDRQIVLIKDNATQQARTIGEHADRIEANRTAIAATSAVATAANSKAEAADQAAKEATAQIAIQKVQISTLQTDLGGTKATVAVHGTRLTAAELDIMRNKSGVERLTDANATLSSRVTIIEGKLPEFAKVVDLNALKLEVAEIDHQVHLFNEQIVRLDKKDLEQDLALENLRIALNQRIDDMDLRITIIDQRLTELKAIVDGMNGGQAGVFPDFTVIGSVYHDELRPENRWTISSVNQLINSHGNPMTDVFLELEVDRGSGYGRVARQRFSDLDGGASMQYELTVMPGEMFTYRTVITDRFRPGWIKHLPAQAFTRPL